jgi:hypothetical protein
MSEARAWAGCPSPESLSQRRPVDATRSGTRAHFEAVLDLERLQGRGRVRAFFVSGSRKANEELTTPSPSPGAFPFPSR